MTAANERDALPCIGLVVVDPDPDLLSAIIGLHLEARDTGHISSLATRGIDIVDVA